MNDASQGKKPFLATLPGVLLACLASCLLWGSAFPCVKIGYALFGLDSSHVASIFVFAGTRFMIAGTMVVVGMSIARKRPYLPARSDLPPVLALCTFQTFLQYTLFYVGLTMTTSVMSSIIEALNTFFTVLLAAFVFHSEKFTATKAIGCAVGFVGVLLVTFEPGESGFALGLGEVLMVLSTLAAATSSNLAKRFAAEGHDPVLLSGWQFMIGGAATLVLGLLMGGRLAPADATNPMPAFVMLLYLAFISAAAYSLWSSALAVNPVSRVAVFGFMNPVFGALLSTLLLDEASTLDPLLAVVALVLVSLGVVIVNREPRKAR